MGLNMQNGFNKGFFNYRKAIEKQFNQSLVISLANYHQKQGNWNDLRDNRRRWHDLVNLSSVEPEESFRLKPPPRDHLRPRDHSRPPPPRRRKNQEEDKPNGQRKPPRVLPPVVLFDELKEFVIGMKEWQNQELVYHEILNDNQVIGYLGTLKNNSQNDKQDQLFVKNIKFMLLKIGLIMIAFAIFITFPIAKYFTKLINKLTWATQKIAAGDYSTRIKSDRQDELGTLANNFNLLAQSLESNAGVQKTIMADIAHELRTPISVIISEIEAIQDGIHKADENTLNLLHAQISSLKNLVNDLHELSESDLGSLKYKMQEFDLQSLLEQIYHNFKLKFSQKNIHLELFSTEKTCFIVADMNRLNQLFNNLLNNSVLYTNKGGKAQISLNCDNNAVNISIKDSSPGLDTMQLEKIFNRWYRAEKSRNKNLGGSGLGLSICKEIIKAHNGEIKASPSSLGGIEINITLPRKLS